MNLLSLKQLILLCIACMGLSQLSAQDAWKDYKDANAYYNQYIAMPAHDAEKLQSAINSIESALKGVDAIDKAKSKAQVYLLAGDIQSTIAQNDMKMAMQSGNFALKQPKASLDAQHYFKMAMDVTDKGFQKGDAMQKMHNNITTLSAIADNYVTAEKYDLAYEYYNALINAVDLMKANDYSKSVFVDEKQEHQIRYRTAFTAMAAKKYDETERLLKSLENSGYDAPEVYSAFYNLYSATEKADEATRYLEMGRTKHPQDKSLLYAEINDALKHGEMESLVVKLQKAIEQDPENASLYTTLGFVYDNLFQKAYEEDNAEMADMHFKNALSNYQKASSFDDNSDANYSIGALYYNKAAVIYQKMAAIADDLSPAATKKYDAYQADANAMFDQALPYFIKAERGNPNDINTLIALKEIFAKKGSDQDIEKSNELKKRIQTIQAGGTNESSMF